MKFKGKKLDGLNTDVLVLLRGNERLVFKAQALQNYTDYNRLCPTPEPPVKILPGGIKEANYKDANYIKKLEDLASSKTDYTIIKSLEPTTDLEWESVDINKPETWKNWRTELEESGFTEIEILRILQLCTRVNALDDNILNEARESFLAEALPQGV